MLADTNSELCHYNNEWIIIKRRSHSFIELIARLSMPSPVLNLDQRLSEFEVYRINNKHSLVKITENNTLQVLGVINVIQTNWESSVSTRVSSFENLNEQLAELKLEISILNNEQFIFQRRSQNIIESLAMIVPTVDEIKSKFRSNEYVTITLNGESKIVEKINECSYRIVAEIRQLNPKLHIASQFMKELSELFALDSETALHNLNEHKIIAKKLRGSLNIIAIVETRENIDNLLNAELIEFNGNIQFVRTVQEIVTVIGVAKAPVPEYENLLNGMAIVKYDGADAIIKGTMPTFEIIAYIRFLNETGMHFPPTVYIPINND